MNHIVKIAIYCVIVLAFYCWTWVLFVKDPNSLRKRTLMTFVLMWPFIAAISRNLHALAVHKHFKLGSDGMDIVFWDCDNTTQGFYLPYLPVEHRFVSWEDFIHATDKSISQDYIPLKRALVVETRDDCFAIGSDVFTLSPSDLQARISRCLQVLHAGGFEQAEELETLSKELVHDFQSHRFATPMVLRCSSWLTNAGTAAGILVFLGIASHLFGPWLSGAMAQDIINLGTVFLVVGGLLSIAWYLVYRRRFLVISADGFSLSSSPSGDRFIPWLDVMGTKLSMESSSIDGHAMAGSCTLEVKLKNGSNIFIEHIYTVKRTLQDGSTEVDVNVHQSVLQELFDPAPSKVMSANDLLAQGETLEKAVLGADLPWP